MTAIPVPPMSRLDDDADSELFEESTVKKSLRNAFDTPVVVKKRISRLSINFQKMPVEYMKVFLRLRPFTEKEIKENENQKCMKISDDKHIFTVMAPKDSKMYKASSRGVGESVRHFVFTKIFDDATGQKEFFTETASPLVKGFIDGNNALIFTYGVTNAGKTYTIQGTPGNEGIIPQAIECLFEDVGDKLLEDVKFHPKMANNLRFLTEDEKQSQDVIKEEVLSMADESRYSLGQSSNATMESSGITEAPDTSIEDTVNSSRGQSIEKSTTEKIVGPVRYAVFASFIEVYKELTYDLLTPLPDEKRQLRPVLVITDDGKGTSYVKGMREIQVNSAEEVLKILSVGRRNLHVAATKINKDSSRSHCIFTLTLVQVSNIPDPYGGRVSKISFCDLAGSERANKTREVGDRLKEAGKINQSLMKLGMCIEALRHNQRNKDDKQKQRAVSFRDSKLTRLFRSYLLGEGRACMVVNANMCASVFDETAQVLKFSAIAKEIQIINKPKNTEKKKSRATLFDEKFETSIEAVNKKPRATIAWERKLTPVKDLKEDQEDGDVAESEEESDEEDIESDSDDEEQGSVEHDISFWKNREETFRKLIEILQKEISQEKIKSQQQEQELRNQFAQHLRNQIVTIEERHTDRIEDTISMMEDEQHKRMGVMRGLSNIDLKEMKERFQKKYWDLTAKNETTEKEFSESQVQLKSKTSELQVAEDKLTSLDLQVNMLKMDLDKKGEEIAALQKQSRRSRYSGNMDTEPFMKDLRKENEEGRSIIASLMEELDGYRTNVEEAQEDNNKLNEALEAAHKKISEITETKDEFENVELEKLKQQHLGVEKKITLIEEKSTELRNTLCLTDDQDMIESGVLSKTANFLERIPDWLVSQKLTCTQLTESIEKEKVEKSDLESQISSMNANLESMKGKVESLIQENALKNAEVKNLNDKKNEMLEDHENELKNAEKELNSLKEKNNQQIEELSEKLKEFEIASSKLAVANAKVKELVKEVEESKKFEQQLVKETNRLHDVVEDLKKDNSKLKQTSQKRTSDASDLIRDVDILTRDRNDLLTRVEAMQRSLDETKAEKTRLEEEFCENVANNTTVQGNSEITDLKSTISQKGDLINLLEKQKDEYLKKQTCLEEKCSEFEKTIERNVTAAEKEKSSLLDKIEEFKKGKYEKETELQEKESELGASQTKVENITQEREEVKSQIKQLKQIDSEREIENQQLAEKIKTSENNFEKLSSEKESLEKEQKNLNEKIETLEEDLRDRDLAKRDDIQNKNEAVEDNVKLTEELGSKQSEIDKLEKEFTKHKTKSEDEILKTKKDLESKITSIKNSHEKEIKKIETQNKKAVDSKEKELANFRENRDRIVAALEIQINNDKSTNEILKVNLDEQMAEIVRLKSRNAASSAENTDLKKQIKVKNSQVPLNKRLSATAVVALEPIVHHVINVKSEPKSPVQNTTLSPRKRTSDMMVPSKDPTSENEQDKSAEENIAPIGRRGSSRGGRGRKRGVSTSTRSRGSRRTKAAAARPATPFNDGPSDDEDVTTPAKMSKCKTRVTSSAITKKEVMEENEEEHGVLDDSELLKETGHSHNFPKSTMELDVTPRVSKKAAKTRKRATKKEERAESESQANESSPLLKRFKFLERFVNSEETDSMTAGLRASTRKTRGNANNSNNSKTSDEDNSTLSVAKNLTKVGGMIRNSPVGQALKCIEAAIAPTAKSPRKVKKQPDEQPKKTRRLVKLHADDISLPLEATPSPECTTRSQTTHSVSETPARMIRRLRRRK